MTRHRRRLAAIAAAVTLAVPARALSEPQPAPVPPPVHFSRPPVCSAGTVALELPPGYYFAEPTFDKLDLELRRAQDAETRLAAENEVFKRHARAGTLGWRGTALIAGTAFAAGVGTAMWLERR